MSEWKLVPVEPTEEMIDAGCDLEPVTRYGSNGEVLRERYKAMLDAAPKAPPAASAQKGLTDERIREIFFSNGFTIKEDLSDLKPYVYAAARALLREAGRRE